MRNVLRSADLHVTPLLGSQVKLLLLRLPAEDRGRCPSMRPAKKRLKLPKPGHGSSGPASPTPHDDAEHSCVVVGEHSAAANAPVAANAPLAANAPPIRHGVHSAGGSCGDGAKAANAAAGSHACIDLTREVAAPGGKPSGHTCESPTPARSLETGPPGRSLETGRLPIDLTHDSPGAADGDRRRPNFRCELCGEDQPDASALARHEEQCAALAAIVAATEAAEAAEAAAEAAEAAEAACLPTRLPLSPLMPPPAPPPAQPPAPPAAPPAPSAACCSGAEQAEPNVRGAIGSRKAAPPTSPVPPKGLWGLAANRRLASPSSAAAPAFAPYVPRATSIAPTRERGVWPQFPSICPSV